MIGVRLRMCVCACAFVCLCVCPRARVCLAGVLLFFRVVVCMCV